MVPRADTGSGGGSGGGERGGGSGRGGGGGRGRPPATAMRTSPGGDTYKYVHRRVRPPQFGAHRAEHVKEGHSGVKGGPTAALRQRGRRARCAQRSRAGLARVAGRGTATFGVEGQRFAAQPSVYLWKQPPHTTRTRQVVLADADRVVVCRPRSHLHRNVSSKVILLFTTFRSSLQVMCFSDVVAGQVLNHNPPRRPRYGHPPPTRTASHCSPSSWRFWAPTEPIAAAFGAPRLPIVLLC